MLLPIQLSLYRRLRLDIVCLKVAVCLEHTIGTNRSDALNRPRSHMPFSPQKISIIIINFLNHHTSLCLWIKAYCKTRLQYIWFRHKLVTFTLSQSPALMSALVSLRSRHAWRHRELGTWSPLFAKIILKVLSNNLFFNLPLIRAYLSIYFTSRYIP